MYNTIMQIINSFRSISCLLLPSCYIWSYEFNSKIGLKITQLKQVNWMHNVSS